MTDSTGAVHAPHPDITATAHRIHAELTGAQRPDLPEGATIGVYVAGSETLYVLVGALTAEFVLGHQGPIGLRVATVDAPKYSLPARAFWLRIVNRTCALIPRDDAGRPLVDVQVQLIVEQYWDGPAYVRDGVHHDDRTSLA